METLTKLNSKNLILVYRDFVSRYYKVCEPGMENKDLIPIIFSGGQMEHKLQHFLDSERKNRDAITKNSCYQCDWVMYDSNIHIPYIRIYDYLISKEMLNSITTGVFAESIISFIEYMKENGNKNFNQVDLYGISCGGINAIKAAKSENVRKVIAQNPPIFGSPLSRVNKIRKLKEERTISESIFLWGLSQLINEEVGFIKEYANGYLNQILDLKDKDLSKITLLGGTITNNPLYEGNKLVQFLNNFILKYGDNNPNDGVVIWLKDILNQYGINFEETKYSFHLDVTKPENIEKGMNLLYKK